MDRRKWWERGMWHGNETRARLLNRQIAQLEHAFQKYQKARRWLSMAETEKFDRSRRRSNQIQALRTQRDALAIGPQHALATTGRMPRIGYTSTGSAERDAEEHAKRAVFAREAPRSPPAIAIGGRVVVVSPGPGSLAPVHDGPDNLHLVHRVRHIGDGRRLAGVGCARASTATTLGVALLAPRAFGC
jgi:hypothetical protein